MVDFQSRDTSRGISDDEEDDEEGEEVEPDEETAAVEESEEPEESGESEETAQANTGSAAADVQTSAGPGTDTAETGEGSDGDTPAETEAETQAGDDASPEGSASGHEGDSTPAGIHADHSPEHDGDHAEGHETDQGHEQHSEGDNGHGANHGHDHHAEHHHADVEQLGVAVVTVSSSRDLDHDPSGDAIQSLVEDEGHSVVARDLVADDLDGVQRAVLALTGRGDTDVVVTTGGTGITPDDVTVEAVRPLFDKELPGFGELFRILSYEEVGTRALGTRATAGVSEGVPVFCLPGSEDAVRTGVEELILAEAPHLVGLARGE